ncbi:unnamed protein product [Brassica oleracea]|uniref:(rape) hypothetical protein n=1 Tax=Brassica napus TaxID=3708 RepID=A0A816MEZ9_BRANA|nr:unnamed protein product [Brassica napus]
MGKEGSYMEYGRSTSNNKDDGDQIEDFSHDREKDEGYFAADGNFVEYVSIRDKKVKVEIKHWFNALGS